MHCHDNSSIAVYIIGHENAAANCFIGLLRICCVCVNVCVCASACVCVCMCVCACACVHACVCVRHVCCIPLLESKSVSREAREKRTCVKGFSLVPKWSEGVTGNGIIRMVRGGDKRVSMCVGMYRCLGECDKMA